MGNSFSCRREETGSVVVFGVKWYSNLVLGVINGAVIDKAKL